MSARVAVTRLELGRHREEENNREKSPHTQQTHVIMRRLALRLRNNSLWPCPSETDLLLYTYNFASAVTLYLFIF